MEKKEEAYSTREKIPEKIMQQEAAWKAPPCVASMCAHINCGSQLLSLKDSAYGTLEIVNTEFFFPLPS